MDEQKQLEEAEAVAEKFWRDQRVPFAKGLEERLIRNLTQLLVWWKDQE